MITYYVLVQRVKINETEQTFEYGAEFPELLDKRRMARILKAGMVGTTRPTDIPEPTIPEINHFEPSQPYVAPPAKPKKEPTKKKSKEDK